MRLALIANDASGRGLDPEEIAGALRRRGADVSLHPISERAAAEEEGVDRIVAAGGDGSIGCCAELAGRLGVPLAVIPLGTANDFARAHDLARDLGDAVELAVAGRRLERLELGRLDGRPFVNVASAGLAPEAARHAHDHKSWLGPLAYLVGAAQAGLTARPVRCAVRVDGELLYAGAAWQIIVSVSGAFGGGSSVEEADPADGVLHVTVVPAGSRLGLLRRAAGMRRGDIAGQPGVPDTEGRVIDLGLDGGARLNVDGEVCAPGRLTVEPAAFELVVG
ncbi:MAG: hypothetical protein M3P50_06055 [Actinomycetota bacterium]|nr:hypothetical protein [Actinomycetota bacterium]